MDDVILTPQQEAEAERIEDNLSAAATVEIRRIARLLASKENRQLFGEAEFQVRDAVHRIAARGWMPLFRSGNGVGLFASTRNGVSRIQRDLSRLLGRRKVRRLSQVPTVRPSLFLGPTW